MFKQADLTIPVLLPSVCGQLGNKWMHTPVFHGTLIYV